MKFLVIISVFLVQLLVPNSIGGEQNFNRVRDFDVLHYKMGLRFNQSRKMVYGDSTLTFKPLGTALTKIELDAREITFSTITRADTGQNLEFEYDKRKLRIDLDAPLEPGQEMSIRFTYTARPKKGIYFVPAVRSRGRVVRSAQIWTQGEAEETRHWLPSYDFPDDKATTEQVITVAASDTVVGNGILLSESRNRNGTKTYHYKMTVPHSIYLSSFVVGRYTKIADRYKDVPLGYYVYPGSTAIAKKAFGKTKDMMAVFEELTGVNYPYNKYDQVMVSRFPFGGMENITATTLADSEVLFADSVYGQEQVQDLIAHELAHSWFGNLVTCRNWAELWTNESFASFMEAAYREKSNGRDDYDEKIRDDVTQYFSYAASSDLSRHGLFNKTADPNNDDTMFDPVTYNKGSAVIHTLREEIGEDPFWTAINVYLNRFKFQNVETEDVKSVFEEVSGVDLDWFFDQWVYRAGHPEIGVRQTFDQSTGELTLQFLQSATKAEDPLALYRLPLEIEIKTSQGTLKEKFLLDQRSEKLTVRTGVKPFDVVIDKSNKIPIKELNQSKLIVLN